MKALMIINPKAGMAKRRRSADYLRREFLLHGYDCDVTVTKKPRDAEIIARSMASEYQLIICLGGDGTLNETVNGLNALKERPPIAYLPTGTTNDFAGSLGLSTDISKAMRDTFRGKKTKLDIGTMNDRCFVYVASFGAFSDSSFRTPQILKNRFGRLAYIAESLKELPSVKSHRMRVYDRNGEICRGKYIFGAVSNSTTIGGMLHYKKNDISLSDGKHEVLLVKKPSSLKMLKQTAKALITGNYRGEGIEMFHASHVRFESEDETAWSLDGERCEPVKIIDIDNFQKAIEFIVPKQIITA